MKKRLLLLLAVIGLFGVTAIVVSSLDSQGSVYQGRPVKAWLFQLLTSDPKAHAEAEAALEALGTNAVPELTRLALAQDPGWQRLIWIHMNELPRPVRARVLRWAGSTNACVFRPLAAQALGKLGPAAAPAVPALIQMLRQGGSAYEQQAAAQSLAQIGAPALAGLVDIVAHEKGTPGNAAALALLSRYHWPRLGGPTGQSLPGDPAALARQQAIDTLGASGRVDDLVIKVLARAAVDPAPGVRLAALQALARANRNPQAALPQLDTCSRDSSPVIREWAARALGKIGPPTQRAIPALTELAQDQEESVRAAAKAALESIAQGGTTNPPAPPK